MAEFCFKFTIGLFSVRCFSYTIWVKSFSTKIIIYYHVIHYSCYILCCIWSRRETQNIIYFQTFSFLLVNYISLNHIKCYDIVIILTVTIVTHSVYIRFTAISQTPCRTFDFCTSFFVDLEFFLRYYLFQLSSLTFRSG